MSATSKIVVTGASGQLGRLVLRELVKRSAGTSPVGVVRHKAAAEELAGEGVEARIADYNDPASLVAALSGADRVLLISSSEVGQRVPQHGNVIEAAVAANAKLLAYTSILHADTNPMMLAAEHRETEQLIRRSGLPFAFLRNGWYTENYTQALGVSLQHGAIIGAAAAGRLSTASRADYAEAAAAVLCDDHHATNRVYELAGDEAFTLADLAEEVSRQSKTRLAYQHLSEADYKIALVSLGLPEAFANLLADSDAKAAEGALFDNGRDLSRLIGRPTTPMASTVAEALSRLC